MVLRESYCGTLVKTLRTDASFGQIIISETGKNLIHKRITAEDAFAEVLLKYQLPMSKKDSSWKDYNLKPLVATLHLIKKVNKLSNFIDICGKQTN